MHRDSQEQVVGQLRSIAEDRRLAAGGSRTARSPYQSMPRSPKAVSSASDAAGDGGIGTPMGMTSDMSESRTEPSVGEVVVHQERGLAWRRWALERC